MVADRVKDAGLVLEIGGGNGFQSRLLSELAQNVMSLDISRHPEPMAPVTIYDGYNIPLADGAADCVFSSNVLEHIVDLDRSLEEMRRVLADTGLGIHILPTPSWRIWTSLTHYIGLPRLLWGNLNNLQAMNAVAASDERVQSIQSDVSKPGRRVLFRWKWIGSILLSQRHGERGNRLTEAFYYREAWWRQKFLSMGWQAVESFPTGLFYSGNIVFGQVMSIETRRKLASVFGSSTRVFILKKS